MKKSQLDRAIDQIEGEIQVLQAAKLRLQQAQGKPVVRKPRPVAAVPSKESQTA